MINFQSLTNKDTNMNYETKVKNVNAESLNLDPISDEPGAHPVGTGIGAALGGAAAGAVAGGLSGKGIAEMIDPTAEEVYWRENYQNRPYVKGRSFDDYGPAYNYGVKSYQKYPNSRFDDVESNLANDWNNFESGSTLGWPEAKHASRDAWDRLRESANHRNI